MRCKKGKVCWNSLDNISENHTRLCAYQSFLQIKCIDIALFINVNRLQTYETLHTQCMNWLQNIYVDIFSVTILLEVFGIWTSFTGKCAFFVITWKKINVTQCLLPRNKKPSKLICSNYKLTNCILTSVT